MMGLIALLAGSWLGLAQAEPPAGPGEEKPAAKAADEKPQAEKPAEGKTAPPKPAAGRPALKPQAPAARNGEPERVALSEADLKALHDNNIFSPRRVKRAPTKGGSAEGSSSSSEAAGGVDRQTKPRPPIVTGFIYDQKSQCHVVVMEDRNGPAWKLFKEPKFLKTGDEVVGFRVGSVERDKVVLTWGDESSAVLKVGEPAPDIGFQVPDKAEAAPSASPVKEGAEASPQDEAAKKKVLEELRGRYKKNRKGTADEP